MADRRALLDTSKELAEAAYVGARPAAEQARAVATTLAQLATDAAGPKANAMPEPVSVDEVLSAAGRGTKWIVDGYVPENALVMLSSASGTGKSWLLAHMIACGERGEPFLTHAVRPFTALWLSEEGPATLAEKIRPFGLTRVRLWTRDHIDRAPKWPELVHLAATEARRIGATLVAVDPFATWARHEGDAEQGSGPMTEAIACCLSEAKDGLTWILLHHDTRAGNPFRGSGAIKAGLDVGLWLRLLDPEDHDGPRILSVEKARPSGCPTPVAIRLEGGRYTLEGSPADARAEALYEPARRALADAEPEGISSRDLASALGVRKTLALKVAKEVGRSTGKGNRARWHPQ
jgi:hypothetical protein